MSALPGADRPRWSRGTLAAVIGGGFAAALLLWGYFHGRAEQADERAAEAPVATGSRTRTVNGETVVVMDAAARARGGIVVAPAVASTGGGLTGYGQVVALDTMAALHNEHVATQSAVVQAQARAEASHREYERLAALHADEQNVSAKVVEAARATMLADQAALATAAAPAGTLAATARQDWGRVVGTWIVTGSPEFQRLMAGREVLVRVTVPFGEGGSNGSAPPSTTRSSGAALAAPAPSARLETGPGTGVLARYVSTAARANPGVQGPSYYYVAPGTAGLLPGMNVTATLLGRASADHGVAVPDSSIVWTNGAPWVYVQLDSNTFARRRIAVGTTAALGGVFVTTVAPGTPIVVRGAQVLLSEELRPQTQGATGDEGDDD